MKIVASTEAKIRVFECIVEHCDSEAQLSKPPGDSLMLSEKIGGSWWMSLWQIHIASKYSIEYVRQVVKALYHGEFALIKTKKGAAFFYRPKDSKVESILKSLEKVLAKERKSRNEQSKS